MKVLIVGLGSIGQRHLCNLRQIFGKNIEISAYRSRGLKIKIFQDMTVEKDVDLDSVYAIKTYSSYAEALKWKPDAVIITNPTKLHIPAALEAARHGCHLFIEKPISDSLMGLDELNKIVKEQGLVAMVGYQMRFHPGLKLIKKLLVERKIGQVITVSSEFGEYLPNAHPWEDYRAGYAARKDLGGGVLLSLSHELDYLQWLFGLPQKLFALGGNLSSLEIEADDAASILMENLVDGKRASVRVHLDFIQRPPARNFNIVGEEGKIFWDYYSNKVKLWTIGKGEWTIFNFDNFERNNMYVDEIKYFINCLEKSEEPEVNIEEASKSLRLALAIKDSISTGRVVENI